VPDELSAVVCAPDVGAAAAAALVGRAAGRRAECFVYDSQELVEFFRTEVQQRLPRSYRLVLCGLEVVHTDWDGRVVRPRLMDALRGFLGPIRWYSARPWLAEDRRAVGHAVGEGNLIVDANAQSVAALVRDACLESVGDYERSLVRMGAEPAGGEEAEAEGRLILTSLKADHARMAAAVGMLIEGRLDELIEELAEEARGVDEQNRRFAEEHCRELQPMGEHRMAFVALPRQRHAFWAEVGAYARAHLKVPLSLCHLTGRSVLLLARERSLRADLRVWARYVTDLMPPAQSVGARPAVVPLVVRGLADDPGMIEEAVGLLRDGAHLLRD
jgi:hypothetical protein